MDDFSPLEKPIQFGYLAAADGLGLYPVFRYRGSQTIIVRNHDEDEAAAAKGYHQVNFGQMDAPRMVDYGYDLYRLNPMQLKLYAHDIGLDLSPDLSIAACVVEIQHFMLNKASYQGRFALVAQEIKFDYTGAQEEIREIARAQGGILI